MVSKDIHISTLKGRRKGTKSLKVRRKHSAALKVRRKRTATLKVRRKRTPAMRPFAGRPFNGPLPPGPIPPPLLPPIAGPPLPPPSSFSEPAMFPMGFGLMSRSYMTRGQPFERERFQGELIHTGSSSQQVQRNTPTEKEKESKQPISLTIHFHNPKEMKKITHKSVVVEKSKRNLEKIKEITSLNNEPSKRKINIRPPASNRLTFLDPRERIEKEKAALSLRKENSLYQNIERKQISALPKAIPNIQTNRNHPLNRISGRLPLRLSEVEQKGRDVLKVEQSQSSFYLQLPSPKSLHVMNEGTLNSNIQISNQPLQAKRLARNHFGRPQQIRPFGFQNGKHVNANELGQFRAPVVSLKGQNANNKIKPGLFGVLGAHGERKSLPEPKGSYKSSDQPIGPIVKTALAGDKNPLASAAYPSKPDLIVKDINTPYKTSNPSRNVNGPYINTQLNTKQHPHSSKLLSQKYERQNVPEAFSGKINKRKISDNIPEIKSELNTVGYNAPTTALPSPNAYNQMLLSLMIIMLQQQQIDKARERMNGKGNAPYSQLSSQLPYLQSIPPIPYRTVPPYQPSVPPIPYQTLPPLPQSINTNQLGAPYMERENVHLSNRQTRNSLSALHSEGLVNHLNDPIQSQQTQLVSSTANKLVNQVNIQPPNPSSTKGDFSSLSLQNNAQQVNELNSNNVYDQASPVQDYSNNANAIPHVQLQNQNIQAKASAFEYQNELNVLPPSYTQNRGNVLLLQTNPIDKSVHIAPSKDMFFKGSETSSSQIIPHSDNAATLGHSISQGQHSSQQHIEGNQVIRQTGPYQPSMNENIAGHQLRITNGASSSVPEKASISVPASSFSKQNTQVQGSSSYKPHGLVLDVTDIKEKGVLVQGNSNDVFQNTGGLARNIPQNDLNSKLDRLLSLFEKQGASSSNANSANKSYSVKLPPASLKRTNPQLYEEILEQNAEQAGSLHEL